MAVEFIVLPLPAPDVKAVSDLSAFQFKAVRFDAGGVRPATTNPDSGPVYVLHNKPNSGQACTLVGIGNVPKAVAGDTIKRGDLITFNSSQCFIPTSAGRMGADSAFTLLVGQAFGPANSGDVFPLYVRY